MGKNVHSLRLAGPSGFRRVIGAWLQGDALTVVIGTSSLRGLAMNTVSLDVSRITRSLDSLQLARRCRSCHPAGCIFRRQFIVLISILVALNIATPLAFATVKL